MLRRDLISFYCFLEPEQNLRQRFSNYNLLNSSKLDFDV